MSPLLLGPGNIHGFVLMANPTDKDRLLLKHQLHYRHFRCEDNNVAFYARATSLLSCAYRGGALSPIRVK